MRRPGGAPTVAGVDVDACSDRDRNITAGVGNRQRRGSGVRSEGERCADREASDAVHGSIETDAAGRADGRIRC